MTPVSRHVKIAWLTIVQLIIMVTTLHSLLHIVDSSLGTLRTFSKYCQQEWGIPSQVGMG